MLLNLDRHTTTSTIYLILLTNVAGNTILKFAEEIDLNATTFKYIHKLRQIIPEIRSERRVYLFLFSF